MFSQISSVEARFTRQEGIWSRSYLTGNLMNKMWISRSVVKTTLELRSRGTPFTRLWMERTLRRRAGQRRPHRPGHAVLVLISFQLILIKKRLSAQLGLWWRELGCNWRTQAFPHQPNLHLFSTQNSEPRRENHCSQLLRPPGLQGIFKSMCRT